MSAGPLAGLLRLSVPHDGFACLKAIRGGWSAATGKKRNKLDADHERK
jgi:hypothetical protein